MPVTITNLELENVKRIKAVSLNPSASGLTIVGGRNNQGKTSVLDSIAWALGGEDFRPSQAQREGSTIPPNLKVTLSNGLIVERKGKNSTLKVTDPSGQKAGQTLLNSFIEKLALNLPKFIASTSKEKASILLNIIGVEEQLLALNQEETGLYNERLTIGRIADKKRKYAEEMTTYPEAPEDLISAADLIKQQQEILARNGENQRKREQVVQMESQAKNKFSHIQMLQNSIEMLQKQLADQQAQLQQETEAHKALMHDINLAKTAAEQLQDESTAELEASISNIDDINRKVRANFDHEKAVEDAAIYEKNYKELSDKIEKVRQRKSDLLSSADLPLPELSVQDGELVYKGQKWDNMSGSDQLRVSTAIVRKLNPECGFVLMDKLEQMDLQTLQEFGAWLESEGLQVIATRVSTGDECSIIIEDGYAAAPQQSHQIEKKEWKAGVF